MAARAHVLVANEPPTYRDLLASELPRLRPRLTVLLVDPADLDEALAQMRPRLVICSELTDSVRQHGIASIVLYPEGRNQAILDIAGAHQVLPNPAVSDLLAAVDAATS
jgi:DNA-binding IclR family transcriptional regulator